MPTHDTSADLIALDTGRISPITGKPLYRITKKDGEHIQDWHVAETATGAVTGYIRMLAIREAARLNPRSVPAAEILPPPTKMLIRRVPPSVRIERFDDADEFLYHATATWHVASILERGLLPGCAGTFTNYAGYTRGKLFLTERGGVPYWTSKVRSHLEHNHDHPPGASVLRIPRAAIVTQLNEDSIGTRDSLSPSYYVTSDIAQRPVSTSEYEYLRRLGTIAEGPTEEETLCAGAR